MSIYFQRESGRKSGGNESMKMDCKKECRVRME